jgi:acetyl esterase
VYATEELTAAGPAGDIRLRVYRPTPAVGRSPAVVFFHGDGFVICSLDTHDAPCCQMAVQTGAVVISVDYRMAPEHRYPAAAEDAEAATRWSPTTPAPSGINPSRIAVAGDSAGGNLTAVVAQRCTKRPGPILAYQLLIYPMLDHAFDTESYRRNGSGYAVTIDHLRWYWDQYLGGQDGADPMASPLRAAGEQIPMPAQDHVRPHEQLHPAQSLQRQPEQQRRQQRSVTGLQSHLPIAELALQHGDLLA